MADACDAMLQALPQPNEPDEVWFLRRRLGNNPDFACLEVPEAGLWVVYLTSLVSAEGLRDHVLRPAGVGLPWHRWPDARPITGWEHAVQEILTGMVFLSDGRTSRVVDLAEIPQRSVSEASTEKSTVGPKEAFIERVQTNMALLRRRLPTPTLSMEQFLVGRRSRTSVVLAYLDDVVRPGLVQRIRGVLGGISTDFVRNAYEIGEYLVGSSRSMFPLLESTERPDRVAQGLALGRAALLVDGTPFALLMPTTIWDYQRDDEKAFPGPLVTAFIRGLRVLGSVIAVLGPGFYVAVLSLNISVLWPSLAMALAVARSGVPYPVLTETLIMLVVVDVFAEATVSAPGGVGNALSIVGTLIIGQISVQARLASELLMITVAAAAMGSFLTLKYPFSYGLRVWKYLIVLMSAMAGLFGWAAGLSLMLLYLASLRSLGTPYVAPSAPLDLRAWVAYAIARAPRPQITRRPSYWHPQDPTRGRRR